MSTIETDVLVTIN